MNKFLWEFSKLIFKAKIKYFYIQISMNEPQQPSTSENATAVTSEEQPQLIDPFIDFECHVCHLKERTLFGELKVIDGR